LSVETIKLDSLLRIDIDLSVADAMIRLEGRFLQAKRSLGLDETQSLQSLKDWTERHSLLRSARCNAFIFALAGGRINAGFVRIDLGDRCLPVRLLFSRIVHCYDNDDPLSRLQALRTAIHAHLALPSVGALEAEAIVLFWGRGLGSPFFAATHEMQLAVARMTANAAAVCTKTTNA
jgi:hypothetical protein